MLIFRQTIITQWTKASRGAPLATLRNKVPDDWPVELFPPLPTPATTLLLSDEVFFYEDTAFQTPTIKRDLTEATGRVILSPGVGLLWQDKRRLQVQFQYSYSIGAPPRTPPLVNVFQLQVGQWGRLVFNGRWGGDMEWIYRKYVVNVAPLENATEAPFAGGPVKIWRDLAELW